MINIKNYDEIIVEPNTLVILDIDETIIKFENINQEWWKTIKNFYEIIHSKKLADELAYNDWLDIIYRQQPELLDEELFLDLLDRINKLNNDLILLTARHNSISDITMKNLEDCGLKIDQNNIYYSWNKGKKIMEIYKEKYEGKNIIFVDDKIENILDVENKLKNTNINYKLYLLTHENLT